MSGSGFPVRRRCGTADRAEYDGCMRSGGRTSADCLAALSCDTGSPWAGDMKSPREDPLVLGSRGGGDLGAGETGPISSVAEMSSTSGGSLSAAALTAASESSSSAASSPPATGWHHWLFPAIIVFFLLLALVSAGGGCCGGKR